MCIQTYRPTPRLASPRPSRRRDGDAFGAETRARGVAHVPLKDDEIVFQRTADAEGRFEFA